MLTLFQGYMIDSVIHFFLIWSAFHAVALIAFFFLVEVPKTKVVIYPFLLKGRQTDLVELLGAIVDISFNLFIATVWFLWPPVKVDVRWEVTFSQRLQNYKLKSWWWFWHKIPALLICAFIELFVPNHCNKNKQQ